jgi:hypothetical protein
MSQMERIYKLDRMFRRKKPPSRREIVEIFEISPVAAFRRSQSPNTDNCCTRQSTPAQPRFEQAIESLHRPCQDSKQSDYGFGDLMYSNRRCSDSRHLLPSSQVAIGTGGSPFPLSGGTFAITRPPSGEW